jgi:hypothetical protein
MRKRGERLSVFDVTQIVQNRSIQSRLELVALAVSPEEERTSSHNALRFNWFKTYY